MSAVIEKPEPLAIEKVRALESVIRQMPDQFDIEENTFHHFCGGLYARELFVPAGYTIVGKQHATQNFFFLIKGEMSLSLADGTVARIRAPFMTVTEPGDKRVGFAHEDSICMNVLANPDDERDLVVLENRYTMPEALPASEAKELLE